MATQTSELTKITDEDVLRRMWQDADDFSRKKEIRAHMYKLREARLREFYSGGDDVTVIRGSTTKGTSAGAQTTTHTDALTDHSFMSLKSKEVRDSESPTRDVSYRVASKDLRNNDNAWNVVSQEEKSDDGKSRSSSRIATTSGTRQIDDGVGKFAALNEEQKFEKHTGDDNNYTKTSGESARTAAEEHFVSGDDNNYRTSSSKVTSSSSRVVTKIGSSTSGDDVQDFDNKDYGHDFDKKDYRQDSDTKNYRQDFDKKNYRQDYDQKDYRQDYEKKNYRQDFDQKDSRQDYEKKDYRQDYEKKDYRQDYDKKDYRQDFDTVQRRDGYKTESTYTRQNEQVRTDDVESPIVATKDKFSGHTCSCDRTNESFDDTHKATHVSNVTSERTTKNEKVTNYPVTEPSHSDSSVVTSRTVKVYKYGDPNIPDYAKNDVVGGTTEIVTETRRLPDGSTVTKTKYKTVGPKTHDTYTTSDKRDTRTYVDTENKRNDRFRDTKNDSKTTITVSKTYDETDFAKKDRADTRYDNTDISRNIQKENVSNKIYVEKVFDIDGSTTIKTDITKQSDIEPLIHVPRETRQPLESRPTELQVTKDHYTTTYNDEYTNKRITVDLSPSHEAFAKSLRSSPDRSVRSPSRGSNRSLPRSSPSPEKYHPGRNDDKTASSETITITKVVRRRNDVSPQKESPIRQPYRRKDQSPEKERTPSPSKTKETRNIFTTTCNVIKDVSKKVTAKKIDESPVYSPRSSPERRQSPSKYPNDKSERRVPKAYDEPAGKDNREKSPLKNVRDVSPTKTLKDSVNKRNVSSINKYSTDNEVHETTYGSSYNRKFERSPVNDKPRTISPSKQTDRKFDRSPVNDKPRSKSPSKQPDRKDRSPVNDKPRSKSPSKQTDRKDRSPVNDKPRTKSPSKQTDIKFDRSPVNDKPRTKSPSKQTDVNEKTATITKRKSSGILKNKNEETPRDSSPTMKPVDTKDTVTVDTISRDSSPTTYASEIEYIKNNTIVTDLDTDETIEISVVNNTGNISIIKTIKGETKIDDDVKDIYDTNTKKTVKTTTVRTDKIVDISDDELPPKTFTVSPNNEKDATVKLTRVPSDKSPRKERPPLRRTDTYEERCREILGLTPKPKTKTDKINDDFIKTESTPHKIVKKDKVDYDNKDTMIKTSTVTTKKGTKDISTNFIENEKISSPISKNDLPIDNTTPRTVTLVETNTTESPSITNTVKDHTTVTTTSISTDVDRMNVTIDKQTELQIQDIKYQKTPERSPERKTPGKSTPVKPVELEPKEKDNKPKVQEFPAQRRSPESSSERKTYGKISPAKPVEQEPREIDNKPNVKEFPAQRRSPESSPERKTPGKTSPVKPGEQEPKEKGIKSKVTEFPAQRRSPESSPERRYPNKISPTKPGESEPREKDVKPKVQEFPAQRRSPESSPERKVPSKKSPTKPEESEPRGNDTKPKVQEFPAQKRLPESSPERIYPSKISPTKPGESEPREKDVKPKVQEFPAQKRSPESSPERKYPSKISPTKPEESEPRGTDTKPKVQEFPSQKRSTESSPERKVPSKNSPTKPEESEPRGTDTKPKVQEFPAQRRSPESSPERKYPSKISPTKPGDSEPREKDIKPKVQEFPAQKRSPESSPEINTPRKSSSVKPVEQEPKEKYTKSRDIISKRTDIRDEKNNSLIFIENEKSDIDFKTCTVNVTTDQFIDTKTFIVNETDEKNVDRKDQYQTKTQIQKFSTNKQTPESSPERKVPSKSTPKKPAEIESEEKDIKLNVHEFPTQRRSPESSPERKTPGKTNLVKSEQEPNEKDIKPKVKEFPAQRRSPESSPERKIPGKTSPLKSVEQEPTERDDKSKFQEFSIQKQTLESSTEHKTSVTHPLRHVENEPKEKYSKPKVHEFPAQRISPESSPERKTPRKSSPSNSLEKEPTADFKPRIHETQSQRKSFENSPEYKTPEKTIKPAEGKPKENDTKLKIHEFPAQRRSPESSPERKSPGKTSPIKSVEKEPKEKYNKPKVHEFPAHKRSPESSPERKPINKSKMFIENERSDVDFKTCTVNVITDQFVDTKTFITNEKDETITQRKDQTLKKPSNKITVSKTTKVTNEFSTDKRIKDKEDDNRYSPKQPSTVTRPSIRNEPTRPGSTSPTKTTKPAMKTQTRHVTSTTISLVNGKSSPKKPEDKSHVIVKQSADKPNLPRRHTDENMVSNKPKNLTQKSSTRATFVTVKTTKITQPTVTTTLTKKITNTGNKPSKPRLNGVISLDSDDNNHVTEITEIIDNQRVVKKTNHINETQKKITSTRPISESSKISKSPTKPKTKPEVSVSHIDSKYKISMHPSSPVHKTIQDKKKKPETKITTKTITLTLKTEQQPDNIIIDMQQAKSSREVTPEFLYAIPAKESECYDKPRHPDMITEPEDVHKKKIKPTKLANIPISESEDISDFTEQRIIEVTAEEYPEQISNFRKITEIDKVHETDESLLSVNEKVSRFLQTAENVTKTTVKEHPTPKITHPDEVDEELRTDECMLSVTDKVHKFLSTAEQLVTSNQEQPKSPRKETYETVVDHDLKTDDCTLSVTEKVQKFITTAEREKQPEKPKNDGPAPKIQRPDFSYVDETLKSDECLLSVSDKVNRFSTVTKTFKIDTTTDKTIVKQSPEQVSRKTSQSPEKDRKPSLDKERRLSPEKERRPSPEKERRLSPEKERRSSPEKDRKSSPEKDRLSPEQDTYDKIEPKRQSPIRKPVKSVDSSQQLIETTDEVTVNSKPKDKTSITQVIKSTVIKSTDAVKKAKALFENIGQTQEKPKQRDILSRPSIWEARKNAKPKDDSDVKLSDIGIIKKHEDSTMTVEHDNEVQVCSDEHLKTTTKTVVKDVKDSRLKSTQLVSKAKEVFEKPRGKTPEKSVPSNRPQVKHSVNIKEEIITTEEKITPAQKIITSTKKVILDQDGVSKTEERKTVETIDRRTETKPTQRKPSIDRRSPEKTTSATTVLVEESNVKDTKFGVVLRRTDSGRNIVSSTTRRRSSTTDPNHQPCIEDIMDLVLLEQMLEKVVGYEQRRRIRSQIREVKQMISEGKIITTKTTTVTTPVTVDSKVKTQKVEIRRSPDRKPQRVDERKSPERKVQKVQERKSPERKPQTSSYVTKKTTEQTIERHTPIRKHHTDIVMIDENAGYQRSTSSWKTKTSTEFTERQIKDISDRETSPVNKIRHKSPETHKKRTPSPDMKPREPKHSDYQQPTASWTNRTATPPAIRTDLKKTPVNQKNSVDEKPEWMTRNILRKTTTTTSSASKNLHGTKTLSELKNKKETPKKIPSPTIKDSTPIDCITSSYGVGPMDENGRPLFGIKALRHQSSFSDKTEVKGTVVTSSFYSENGQEPTGEINVTKYSSNPRDLGEYSDSKGMRIHGLTSVTTTQKFGKDAKKSSSSVKAIKSSQETEEEIKDSSDKIMSATSKVTRRGSVKELSKKFIENAVETVKSERQSYPKAGLILRTSSFKETQAASDDLSSRASSPGTVEFSKTISLESMDSCSEPKSGRRPGNSKSFLNSQTRVTGVKDIITRMKNADEDVEIGDSTEDAEARSLLNKFLGAQVLMSGIEPLLETNTSSTQSSTVISSSASHQDSGRRQVGSISHFSRPVTLLDIEEVWDETILKLLLESSSSYEERRIIRARLRQVMAEQEAGTKIISSGDRAKAETKVIETTTTISGDQQNVQECVETTKETVQEGPQTKTVTTKVTTTQRTVSSKPMSPFAKFRQLDKQNSLPSSAPSSPGVGGKPLFKITDPALSNSAATVKDRLLYWCQVKTKDYKNIQIENFSTSWANGLAFCALIHHFLPDAFDYDALSPQKRRYNFTLAFQVADEKADIAPLLDVEDMVMMRKPDWKCVFTYVQSIYRRFKDEEI